MGALEEGHYAAELEENEVELGGSSGSEPEEPESQSVEAAVRVLLEGLGEDCEREGLKRTPFRVAKAFREGTRGYNQKAKDIVKGALFPESTPNPNSHTNSHTETTTHHTNGHTNGHTAPCHTNGMVIVRDLDLFSYCESCLLPFALKCHVSYLPSSNRVLGLSKLSRVSDIFSKRLQNPNRLAREICAALNATVLPAGVAVLLECWHVKFPEDLGSDSDWVRVCANSRLGLFEQDESLWNDFFALLRMKGVKMNNDGNNVDCLSIWCPSLRSNVNVNGVMNGKSSNNSMVSSVISILKSIGEDPLRKELVGTPYRYVQWLMRFKSCSNPNFKSLSNSNLRTKTGEKVRYELNIPFCSQCEHHLLPFYGSVHVGFYGSGERAISRAEMQSIVEFYACKLQVQERMTRQIAEELHSRAIEKGVIVVVEANHICMISRGIEKVRSSTATISVLGKFCMDLDAKNEFLKSVLERAR
ncbi:hypothetical protein LUZ60_015716 [Juncus effusus]|nr:hypothetical protein LUZ60_015716 [Juncus effusus]